VVVQVIEDIALGGAIAVVGSLVVLSLLIGMAAVFFQDKF